MYIKMTTNTDTCATIQIPTRRMQHQSCKDQSCRPDGVHYCNKVLNDQCAQFARANQPDLRTANVKVYGN